jgi:hypothetical protein
MNVMNVDLAVMTDFEFEPGRPPTQLDKDIPDGIDPMLDHMRQDYAKSGPWLWYRPKGLNPAGAPLFRERRVIYREALKLPDGSPANGLRFMYLPDRGVGVATVSVSNAAWLSDPWQAKESRWGSFGYWEAVFSEFDLLNPTKIASERIYVFLAVRVDTADLSDYCRDQAAAVASWLTGGYERESPERRLSLVSPDNNISHRSYERFFIRWTDALALYNLDTATETYRNNIRPGEMLPYRQDDYRLAHCRAAQLFEHCILARRIFRTDGEQIGALSSKIRLFTSFPVISRNWYRANAVLSAFSQAELEMVVAPPVRSVEAGELVDAALERCGVPLLVEDTRRSYDLLDRRLQWARGQWLATLAVCVFIVNLIVTIFKG